MEKAEGDRSDEHVDDDVEGVDEMGGGIEETDAVRSCLRKKSIYNEY